MENSPQERKRYTDWRAGVRQPDRLAIHRYPANACWRLFVRCYWFIKKLTIDNRYGVRVH